MQQKGFTLIELLIVIAIIAILSVTIILTLNPAQILAQARDSQRISDMSTLKTAISLYLGDVSTSISIGATATCFGSSPNTSSSAGCGARMSLTEAAVATTTATAQASTTGGGWVPIDFTRISSGSPLGSEPVDPVNDATYYYTYANNGVANGYQYKLTAKMESTKFKNGGGSDVESKDGGINANVFESGTNLGL